MSLISAKLRITGLLAAANVTNNAVTFLTGLVLAKFYSIEEYGFYSLATQILLLTQVSFDIGLGLAMVRLSASANVERITQLATSSLLARLLIIAFGSTLFLWIFPLPEFASEILSVRTSTVVVPIIFGMLLSLWTHFRFLFQAKADYKSYACFTLAYAALRVLGILSLMVSDVEPRAEFALALLYGLPVAALIIFEAFRGAHISQFRVPKTFLSDIKSLFSYSRHVALSSFLYPLVSIAPLLFVAPRDLVQFRADYGLALAFAAIVAPFNEAVRAVLVRTFSAINSNNEAINYVSRLYRGAPLYVGASLIAIISVTGLFEILLKDEYPNALPAILVLLSANLAAVYLGTINSMAHFIGRPDWDAKINIGRAVSVIVLFISARDSLSALQCALVVGAALILGESVQFRLIMRELNRRTRIST
jgi:O-antigen/teichoic acid export membrane protein